MNVLLSTDKGGVLGAAVAGRSIAENASPGRPLHFHLFHSGLSDATLRRLESSWQLPGRSVVFSPRPFSVDRVRDLLRSRDIPHMAYARLFLGELLAPDAGRCVYCDIDILFERDLAELHDIDLEGGVLGAVPNSSPEEDRAQLERLGVPGTRYFNTGVLVIDLELWRKHDVEERALSFARSMGDALRMHDQDALNAVLYESWKLIPDDWNWWRPDPPPKSHSVVIHMAMSPKPWQLGYAGLHAAKFFDYLDRTQFAGWRPVGLGPLGRVAWRIKRAIPYWPTVWRTVRGALGRDGRS